MWRRNGNLILLLLDENQVKVSCVRCTFKCEYIPFVDANLKEPEY